MKIYRKNAEEALIQDLRHLYAQREFWCGWHFHFSDLQPGVCTRKTLTILLNLIKYELSDHKVLVYCCYDNDLLMFFPKTEKPPLEKIKAKMYYFFVADPLLCNPPKDKTFSTHLCLEKDYDHLFIESHKKILKIKEQHEIESAMPTFCKLTFDNALEQRRTRTRPQIMVVDDHPFNRNLMAEILFSEADIVLAKDGHEALQFYYESAPDIIFLDIDMPKLDGHCVLQILAEIDPNAFIVMLTSKNKKEDVVKAMNNHANGYITKPFNVQKLQRYIDLFQSRQGENATL